MLRNILKSSKNFFLPYLLIIATMVIFNFINYQYMLRSIQSQSVSSTMSEMNNITLTLSGVHNDIIQFINETDNDTSICNLAKSADTSLLDIRGLSKRLNIARNSISVADNIILYFRNSDIVVDCESAYTLGNNQDMIFSDGLSFDELKAKYFTNPYRNFYIEISDLEYIGRSHRKTYGVVSSLPSDYDIPTMQLIIILNSEKLHELITPMHHPDGAVYDLLDENQTLIYNDSLDPGVFEDAESPKTKRIDGKKYIIYNSPVGNAPFNLVSAIPYSEVIKAATFQRTVIYLTLCLSIVLCILFGIFSAKSSKQQFDSIIETNRSQHRQLSEFTPHMQNEFLRKTLLGEAEPPEILDFNEKYKIIPYAKSYCVLRINIKTDATSEINFAKEMNLKKFIIKNVIEEIYQNTVYVNTGLDNICFILCSNKSEAAFRRDFERICSVIETVLINTVKYKLSYALGTIVSSYEEFSGSFFEAVNSIMLNELSAEEKITADGVCFPIEFENALINAVKHGSVRTINSIFDVLRAVNTENAGELAEYLKVCLNRAADGQTLPGQSELKSGEDYRHAFITLAERGSGSASALFNDILAYVRENFSDPQLSRKLLSDKFKISEEYVSMLFKKNFDITFLNYVEKIRIEHACELITQGGLTLEEIAARCGYVNATSFRRTFKKVTGTLPSQYKN